MKLFVKAKVIEEMLNISNRTLCRLEKQGLPFYRLNNEKRYVVEEIIEWMEARKNEKK